MTPEPQMTPEVTKTVLYFYITVFVTRAEVGILGHESQFDHIFSRHRRENILVKLT
jgi:hypothetical protein